MAKPGRKPLPANVHRLRGNPSKKPIGELVDGVQPLVEIPNCPKHVLPLAKAHWKFITPLLYAEGLIAKIDRTALELYCQAYAWYVWHDTHLQADIKLAEEKRGLWAQDPINASKVWNGGDGFQIPTPNGNFTYNPHWVGKNKAAEQVDKFLASFGMSPSARSRVTASENYPFLPGMEPAETGLQNSAVKPGNVKSLADLVR